MNLPAKLTTKDDGDFLLTVFAVIEKNQDGKPVLLRPIGLDDQVKLSENSSDNWFITGYLHTSGFHPLGESG